MLQIGMNEFKSENILIDCSQTDFEILKEVEFHELETKPVLTHAFEQKKLVVFQSFTREIYGFLVLLNGFQNKTFLVS